MKPNIELPADGILTPAIYSNVASFAWYKDGEIIKNRSALFEVFANGNLKIKNPSPAFNGIYQMFYENQAGTAVVSQAVNASNIRGMLVRLVFKEDTFERVVAVFSPKL